eukprot:2004280-Amphidinium_carterae.1
MYDYHEFLLKAEGLDHIFNYWTTTPRECQTAMASTLDGSLAFLQEHALQSHACVAILLYEAHTLIILALQTTMHYPCGQ